MYAAGTGGEIKVSTRRENERGIIEFWDSGPGVDANSRERVFEPFFTTKPPGDGAGPGLMTAQQIIGHHGGNIRVAESPLGTVFRIELPLAPSKAG